MPMPLEFPELPGWLFHADEVSAGVYRAQGHDRAGRSVEATGLDPDLLIENCKRAAIQMMANTLKSNGGLERRENDEDTALR